MTLKRKLTGRRAIFLISVLFFSILIVMFVEAALVLAPGGLSRAASDSALTAADQAAKSGIDWASNRISNDPSWNANPATPQTFSVPGKLLVTEGSGQVLGWVQNGTGWTRFRIRFNYQDGPQLSAANSDNMNDPPSASQWTDLPYVSCNNLMGGGARQAPLAGNGGAYLNPSPWPTTQLTVPPDTLLLSVEGAAGPVVTDSAGLPASFSGAVHRKTVQTVLRFGNNQPISNAAIMSAGDLAVSLFTPAPLQLSASAGQTARLRTKGNLTVGDVNSLKADLRYVGTKTTGTLSPGVTTGLDSSGDGFYKIPANKVRPPTGSLALNAGVYVVTNAGTVMYYDMDYKNFLTASPAPTGTPVTLPSGMALVGPNAAPSPKYRINVTSDLKINLGSVAKDFALIPDGGAPQSAAYGGGVAATPPPPPPAPTGFSSFLGYPPGLFGFPPTGFMGSPLTTMQVNDWLNVVNTFGLGSSPGLFGYTNYNVPGGGMIGIPPGAGNPVAVVGLPVGNFNSAMAGVNPATLAALQSSVGYIPPAPPGPAPGPGPSAGPTTLLQPADLELSMQSGGSGSLTLSNTNGSVTIGSQIQGNGASIASSKDIALIGTSTDLSSTPGASLGLNLYAQGTITIDAFKLDSTGSASFHGISMKGIVYAWQGINILAGNSTTSAPFNMVGSMVSYGGDPALGGPSAGLATAKTVINAQSASIQYDPSFVAGLVSGGPFTLQVVSWHEF